jgi:hypothetical protein
VEIVAGAAEAQETSKQGTDHEPTITIDVVYNGLAKSLTVSKEDLISSLLQRAIAMFGITQNQHTLSLYTSEGVELQDTSTVKNAKLKKGMQILLRPSTVKAG